MPKDGSVSDTPKAAQNEAKSWPPGVGDDHSLKTPTTRRGMEDLWASGRNSDAPEWWAYRGGSHYPKP